MRRVLIKEQSCYTPESLAEKIGTGDTAFAGRCIEAFTTRGLIRCRTSSEPKEYDPRDEDLNGDYQFVFVGLAMLEDTVFLIYPKYMNDPIVGREDPDIFRAGIQRIFQVIRKASSNYLNSPDLDSEGFVASDRLALMLALVEMYGEYGAYSNYVRKQKTNGPGDISWERTIALHLPFLQDGNAVYFDCETIESAKDTADFVTRLHRCILTECSRFFKNSGISELLALDEIDISDESLESFGSLSDINYRLECELGTQFITWKQDVIHLMRDYVNRDEKVMKSDEMICLGSSSFYHLWEKACKVALDDKLDLQLSLLDIELSEEWQSRSHETLLDIIPRPLWKTPTDSGLAEYDAPSTLIPDIITVRHLESGLDCFGIFDAKYYTPSFDNGVARAPGVDSITKQILYQRAYAKFVADHRFDKAVNCFLVPSDEGTYKYMGKVCFPGVLDSEEPPFADAITMWKLPAETVWQCYLRNEVLPNDVFELLINDGEAP